VPVLDNQASDVVDRLPFDLHLIDRASIKSTLVYESVANAVEAKIVLGLFVPSNVLSTRQFAKENQLPPNTVGKAFRVLTERGLVRPLRSHDEPLFVVTVPREEAPEPAHTLHDIQNAIECRLALEAHAAALAAYRRNNDHLTVLLNSGVRAMAASRQLFAVPVQAEVGNSYNRTPTLTAQELQRADDLRHTFAMAYRRHDSVFHLTIAVATGNRDLQRAIEKARARYLRFVKDQHRYVINSKAVRDHLLIWNSIRDADAEQARHHMQRHIEYTQQMVVELMTT
jgi:DNA-binding FadR family transcriptional regulator